MLYQKIRNCCAQND